MYVSLRKNFLLNTLRAGYLCATMRGLCQLSALRDLSLVARGARSVQAVHRWGELGDMLYYLLVVVHSSSGSRKSAGRQVSAVYFKDS